MIKLQVSTYYKRSKGVMLVYDITQKDTFVAVETWLNEAKQGCHADVMVPIILVGSKSDLQDQHQVSTKEGKGLANKISACGFMEISSLTGEGVNEAFVVLALATFDPFTHTMAEFAIPRDRVLEKVYKATRPPGGQLYLRQ